jgi:hypothetical protein
MATKPTREHALVPTAKKAGSRQWVGPALTLGSGTYTLAAHMGMGVRSFLPSVLRTAVVFID